MKATTTLALCLFTTGAALATAPAATSIRGDYLEVRSCDVYTGPCFANAEMGLAGKEAILLWSVREGRWHDTALDGLKVMAIVRADATLGDQRFQPRGGKAVLILDAAATPAQRAALHNLARSLAGPLIAEVAEIESAPIEARLATCAKAGCSSVQAGAWVNISTRCLGDKDHICGNEESYYPPLTDVSGASPAFTEVASYQGPALDVTWQLTGTRSAFLASFAR
jgi:hypothetical protein